MRALCEAPAFAQMQESLQSSSILSRLPRDSLECAMAHNKVREVAHAPPSSERPLNVVENTPLCSMQCLYCVCMKHLYASGYLSLCVLARATAPNSKACV